MFENNGILATIIILLLVFYLVIRLGAGKKKGSSHSAEVKNYLSSVRILIIILAIVGIILWIFIDS